MFLNLIKKSFNNIISNPILVLFLVLSSIITSIFVSFTIVQTNFYIFSLLSLCSFLFTAVFFAGWLGMFKELALRPEKKDEEISETEYRSLGGVFLESAGYNFVPFAIGLILHIIFVFIFFMIAKIFAAYLFGNPMELLKDIPANTENLMEYIKNIPDDKQLILYGWQLCFMASMLIYQFLFMYFFPALIFNSENNIFTRPFFAIKDAIIFLFENFFKSLGIYVFLLTLYISFAVLKAFLPDHPAVNLASIFFIVYFLNFAVMLICNYYGKNNSCSDRSYSIGENEDCNPTGKEE